MRFVGAGEEDDGSVELAEPAGVEGADVSLEKDETLGI